ncbi:MULTISPECIES: DUF6176 family protein [Gemella]|uniref:DUF6176 family protein n=1 Tax=Gemella TaxID=1378 RepID=UPI0007681439|nr:MULTISPECIES: DUF6176 family protein [Gemella]AME08977.1 hypothetical protein AXE85_01745 [Gemella sp. oral taxon 928]AXI26547.1 hypothetical protein CG018_03515 [Gemella sp. ND 6198]
MKTIDKLNIELTRFKVKDGKSETVDEWLDFLNGNMQNVLLTLEREQMYVETIFRETLNGAEYLYWYSIQGEDGEPVETSENAIDKQHLKYWKECIDPNYPAVDLTPAVVMIPKNITKVMRKL